MAWYDILLAEKLGGGGISVTVDSELSDTSVNPVQNKVITNAIKGLFPKDTATGNPISIADGSNVLPVESCEVAFAPIQSGSGDPSPENVRPISGWDSLSLFGMGKNIAVGKIEDAGYDSSGRINNSDTSYVLIAPIKKGGTYTFSENGVISSTYYGEFTSYPAKQMIAVNGRESGGTFTASVDGYVAILCGNNAVRQIEVGSTATDYEAPITPTIHTATLGSTYYGGTLNFTTGKLTIDKAIFVLDSEGTTYSYNSTNKWFSTSAIDSVVVKGSSAQVPNALCENYSPSTRNAMSGDLTADGLFTISSSGSVLIRDLSTDDVDVFKTRVSGVKLAYPLATPQEITLSPETIELLKGNNTLWTDGDNIYLSYYADIKSYIDKKIAEAQ